MSTFFRTVFFCLFTAVVFGQSSSVQGSITDATGAIVIGGAVTVTNLDTNIVAKGVSNEQGLYLFPSLNPGRYRVECKAPGFAEQAVAEFRLEVGQTARLNFELKPGTVAESITVSSSSVLIKTDQTDVGQVIDGKRILEMPLNGRNYLQLAQFTVGVQPGGGLTTGSRARGEGAFAAVGMQVAQNNVLLDGNDNSSRTSGGPLGFEAQAVKPPVDAVAEFKVVTNNLSAEYGYRAGAKVIVSTRSGTNAFHGSLYEFLRNDKLDATNFFANRSGAKKPTYRQNQYGGTFGGPVIKNRTFFFGSFQRTNVRIGQSYLSSVPSRDIIERYDFSQQPAQRRAIYDPLTLTGTGATAVRQPFAGNIIPATRIDPVIAKILPLYPVANVQGRDNLPNNYFFSPVNADDGNQWDLRGDHNFSDRHRFFARYSLRDQFRDEPGTLPYPAMGGQGQTVDLKAHNIAASLSSMITSTMFNEARFGWSLFDTVFGIPFTENLNPQFGIKNAPGDSFGDGQDIGWTRFTPTGFSEIGARSFWPNFNSLTNYMFTDAVTWQKGSHALKFGGEFRQATVFRNAARFRRGQFGFSGAFTSQFPNNGTSRANTGNGMADMILGWVGSGSMGNNQGENIRNPYFGLFIQDDWKVNSRLTVNFGIRYEVFYRGTFPDAANQSVSRYLMEGINVPTRAEETFAFPTGDRDSGGSNDLNNWAPRLGVAYSITPQTVFRAGVGIFYGEQNNLSTENGNFRSGAPKSADIALAQNNEQTTILVKDGFPPFSTETVQRGIEVYVFPERRATFYAGQWFADIQRNLPFDTLLTIGYNGTKSTNLPVARNVNQPLTPSATAPANTRLIRPQFNAVTLHENMLHANYHSLTVKAEKRFSRGLTFLGSFTWSKNIDQGNEDLLDGSGGGVTPYEFQRERGRSTLDRRLIFNASAVYELPFGKGQPYLKSGPASWVLGGWTLGGIFNALSGLPNSHTINVNNQNLGGAVRGDWVRNPNLPTSERTIDRWFDTTFVVPSAPGAVSNAGRNLIDGPGVFNLDIMVSRSFVMPWEGHRLDFRFESFNFTNTANFGLPATGVGSPGVGTITSAADPRRIQFALKYSF